ncbi:MAG: hypothetical protein Q4G35_04260 [Propionibacteriaceae bacterium]|nr:hypothetical protein [Propionibacteriaceae bacterium]
MELRQNPCLSRCDWHPTDEIREDQPIFECKACKSEWAPSEPWTPQNWDGKVTEAVQAAKVAHS